jgi:hypothetical protein
MRTLRSLLKRSEGKYQDYDDTMGYLTKEDMEKIKAISQRPQRKAHETWICRACNHKYFYMILKCPACESNMIESP